MFSYSMWMFVHLTHLVLSSETFSNEIFCGTLFLIKNRMVVQNIYISGKLEHMVY